MSLSDPYALADVAAKLWRFGLPAVEEDLARTGGPMAGALLRALARAAHLLARAESKKELSDALVLRLTGAPELASMVDSCRATQPGIGLTSRWAMPDQPAPALIRILDGREGDAERCIWSPTGSWLMSISGAVQSSQQHTVRLWDPRTWRPGPTFDHGAGWPNRIDDGVLPSSGEWLATCAAGAVWIWDTVSGELRGMFEGRLVAAAPDGAWLAIGYPTQPTTTGSPGRIALYRMPDGQHLDTFPWHPGTATRATTSSASGWIVTADDGRLRLREMPRGQVRREFNVGGDHIGKVVSAPDASWLAAEIGSYPSRTRVWDTVTGEVRATFACRLGPVHAVTPDGSWIAATPEENRTVLLDTTGTRSAPIPLGEHSSLVTSYAVSPDSARLATGCRDGTIWLWDLSIGVADQRRDPRRAPLSSCATAPDGSWLATTDGNGVWSGQGGIAIWDVTTGQRHREFGSGRYDSCIAAPDGTWLATADVDNVLIWDMNTGRLRHRIECPVRQGEVLSSAYKNYVVDLAVAPDGTWLATACEDGTVRLLDVATGQTRDILEHPAIDGRMLRCVVAADASWLGYSGVGGTVIHDLSNGTSRKADSAGRLLDVSPDGSLLASEQGFDVRVWAAATGETRYVLRGHTDFAKACRWSPDGSRLASIGDQTVRIWAAASGEVETTIRLYTTPTDCCWLPDTRSLAVTSQQGLHLFDLTRMPNST
ncbi:hypothetical protein GCM10022419_116850 [Nonomuraea rosea]|uniref:WD40 repeat domain-containing protein n=1 Tax=Nonomuraea rosea TaxID=638574 RepID=A0ABP6ZNB8_9ACTN